MFPPIFRELPPIPLELFDLDEALAPPQIHLNRLANQCLDDNDPEVFIRGAGTLVGLDPSGSKPAKEVLMDVLRAMVQLRAASTSF